MKGFPVTVRWAVLTNAIVSFSQVFVALSTLHELLKYVLIKYQGHLLLANLLLTQRLCGESNDSPHKSVERAKFLVAGA